MLSLCSIVLLLLLWVLWVCLWCLLRGPPCVIRGPPAAAYSHMCCRGQALQLGSCFVHNTWGRGVKEGGGRCNRKGAGSVKEEGGVAGGGETVADKE